MFYTKETKARRLFLHQENFSHKKRFRNSHRKCSVRKGVLRSFPKFILKHLCQSLRPSAYNFVKKETLAQVFPVNFPPFSWFEQAHMKHGSSTCQKTYKKQVQHPILRLLPFFLGQIIDCFGSCNWMIEFYMEAHFMDLFLSKFIALKY